VVDEFLNPLLNAKNEKPFRNKFLTYPPDVRKWLIERVNEGFGVNRLKNAWDEKYGEQYGKANDGTLWTYIKWERVQQKEYQEGLAARHESAITEFVKKEKKELSRITNLASGAEVNVGPHDARVILRSLVATCAERIALLHTMQVQDKVTPQIESCIQRYIAEIRALEDLQLKREQELNRGNDNDRSAVKQVVNQLTSAIGKTVLVVCPEKKEEFDRVMREELKRLTETKIYEVSNDENLPKVVTGTQK
jgi:hypothetical protein